MSPIRFLTVYRSSFAAAIVVFIMTSMGSTGLSASVVTTIVTFLASLGVTNAFLGLDREEVVINETEYSKLLYKYLLYDAIKHGGYTTPINKLFTQREIATIRRVGNKAVREFAAMPKE